MTAQKLATAFRNGQLRRVAEDILCDGPPCHRTRDAADPCGTCKAGRRGQCARGHDTDWG